MLFTAIGLMEEVVGGTFLLLIYQVGLIAKEIAEKIRV